MSGRGSWPKAETEAAEEEKDDDEETVEEEEDEVGQVIEIVIVTYGAYWLTTKANWAIVNPPLAGHKAGLSMRLRVKLFGH